MAQHRLLDRASVAEFGDWLCDPHRDVPVLLLTTPSGSSEPYADVEALEAELSGQVPIYILETGALTWEFTDVMPEGTACYGGAGRVYPTGTDWLSNVYLSPLRFAYAADHGKKQAELLIDDSLDAAAAGGVFNASPSRNAREFVGTVQGVVAGRALVATESGAVHAVAPEMVVRGVDADRLFVTGMTLRGWQDGATVRITSTVRDPAESLADVAVGDVVLARVGGVERDTFTAALVPGFAVTVRGVDMDWVEDGKRPPPCSDLLSAGEVVELCVQERGASLAQWRLAACKDDDVVPREAPALLAGGPPWLVPDVDDDEDDDAVGVSRSGASGGGHSDAGGQDVGGQDVDTRAVEARGVGRGGAKPAMPTPADVLRGHRAAPEPKRDEGDGQREVTEAARPAVGRPDAPKPGSWMPKPAGREAKPTESGESTPVAPTPTMGAAPVAASPGPVAGVGSVAGAGSVTSGEFVEELRLLREERRAMQALRADLAGLVTPERSSSGNRGDADAGLAVLMADLKQVREANEGLLTQVAEYKKKLRRSTDEASKHAKRAKAAEKALKRAEVGTAELLEVPDDVVLFKDAEDQFRFEVYASWVRRVTADEKPGKPLPDVWFVGDKFLASVDDMRDVRRSKVADVCVDILLGGPYQFGWRPLTVREGSSEAVTRDDGAVCYRANIKQGAAGAPRLHVWKHPDGTFEFENVAHHDDYGHRPQT